MLAPLLTLALPCGAPKLHTAAFNGQPLRSEPSLAAHRNTRLGRDHRPTCPVAGPQPSFAAARAAKLSWRVLDDLRRRLAKDGAVSPLRAARRVVRYAAERASAPLYLVDVDRVGKRVRTYGRPRIDNQGTIELADDVQLRSMNVPVELATGPRGRLVVGEGTIINYGVSIAAMSQVTIGRYVLVATYVNIMDTDFHDVHDRRVRPEPQPVTIEDDVWLGTKCAILRGVTVGKGAVVAIGSVVMKDVPPFTIVGGVPAKEIGKIDPARFHSLGERS
jgi:acetyltransferase-like isoleucine patch superfamily enzyme